MRKKDIVLMATVTSFEGLPMPGKSELKQFSDLFIPLYAQSGEEARRLAVAALSQCDALPLSVCQFIASQPISIAAPFLASSPALDDATLIAIARTQGPDHARAIAARPDLSVAVVDALVNMHDGHEIGRPQSAEATSEPQTTPIAQARETRRAASEELLRQDMKARVMREPVPMGPEARALRETQIALLVRFARQRHAHEFATCLADMIGSTLWLAERIMLDLSGDQLASTLKASDVPVGDALFCLIRFYPHLAQHETGLSRAMRLWDDLDEARCRDRLTAWVRADHYSAGEATERTSEPANHNRSLPDSVANLPGLKPLPVRERRRVKAGSRAV